MLAESNPSADKSSKQLTVPRIAACSAAIVLGTVLGLVSLALASNRFGNYDTIGLSLFGLSSGVVATGIAHLRRTLPKSLAIGVLAAPLSVVALVVFAWLLIISSAFINRAGA